MILRGKGYIILSYKKTIIFLLLEGELLNKENTLFTPAKNTIEQIFDAEKKATRKYQKACELAEEQKAQIPQKKREMAEKYEVLVKEKAEKERERAQNVASRKVEDTKKQTDEQIKNLDENFKKNLNNYIDEVFSATVK